MCRYTRYTTTHGNTPHRKNWLCITTRHSPSHNSTAQVITKHDIALHPIGAHHNTSRHIIKPCIFATLTLPNRPMRWTQFPKRGCAGLRLALGVFGRHPPHALLLPPPSRVGKTRTGDHTQDGAPLARPRPVRRPPWPYNRGGGRGGDSASHPTRGAQGDGPEATKNRGVSDAAARPEHGDTRRAAHDTTRAAAHMHPWAGRLCWRRLCRRTKERNSRSWRSRSPRNVSEPPCADQSASARVERPAGRGWDGDAGQGWSGSERASCAPTRQQAPSRRP